MPLAPSIFELRKPLPTDQEESRASSLFKFLFGERHPLLLYRSPKPKIVAKNAIYFST